MKIAPAKAKSASLVLAVYCLTAGGPVWAATLKAGVARVSINPLEEKIPTQLGGYGARNGKPAEGTLDTIYGKVILFDSGTEKSALITVDTCTVPICVAEETLKKAGIEGLSLDRLLISASHTHTGLEGYALDRRNVANNPHIGNFSEPSPQLRHRPPGKSPPGSQCGPATGESRLRRGGFAQHEPEPARQPMRGPSNHGASPG